MKKWTLALLLCVSITYSGISQNTWYPISSGTTQWIIDIEFKDDNTGYLAATFGVIKKTTDGGATWDSLTSGTTEFLADIDFTSMDTGYAVGGSAINNTPTILKTTDAGNTWVSQNAPLTQHVAGCFFLNSDYGYAIGDGGDVIKTTNGGSTWLWKASVPSFNLVDVYFHSKDTGFVVGMAGMFKTTDGGSTWVDLNLSVFFGGLTAIHFPSHDIGYVVNVSGLIGKTTDGGNTWTQQTSGVTSQLYALAFVDDNVGYAVGRDASVEGKILSTVDGGANWNIDSVTIDIMQGVYVSSSNVAFAVGRNGTILTNVSTLSNEEISGEEIDLVVYPNPSSGLFELHMSLLWPENIELSIYNNLGQLVLSSRIRAPKGEFNKEIDIRDHPAGVYTLQLSTSKGQVNKQIVID